MTTRFFRAADHYNSEFSQFGQDGVITALCSLLNPPKTFLEFGSSGNDLEGSNTALLRHKGWNGILADKDNHAGSQYRVIRQWVNSENVNDLPVAEDLGFLSIDIDGIDYWVWKASQWQPWIVCIESNHYLGHEPSVTVPNNPSFVMTDGKYFGASRKALLGLGLFKGYSLVGICCTDLIFVRTDKLTQHDVYVDGLNDLDALDVAGTARWLGGPLKGELLAREWVSVSDGLELMHKAGEQGWQAIGKDGQWTLTRKPKWQTHTVYEYEHSSATLKGLLNDKTSFTVPQVGIRQEINSVQKVINSLHGLIGYGTAAEIADSGEELALRYALKKAESLSVSIVDGGAHHGSWLKMAKRASSKLDAQFYCFEPDYASFAILQNCGVIAKFYQKALSNTSGKTNIFGVPGSSNNSLYTEGDKDQKAIAVETTTLKEALPEGPIHYLKLDVEGAEFIVIKDALGTIGYKNIRFIQFEFGVYTMRARYYFRDFWELLIPNYHIYRIHPCGIYEITEYVKQLEVFEVANYLAERR